MRLTAYKTSANPAGRPLGQVVREIRLELEVQVGKAQAAAHGSPSLDLALGLQAIGLLLQLEGIDQALRALGTPIESTCPAALQFSASSGDDAAPRAPRNAH